MKIASLLPKTDEWAQRADFETFLESHLTYILQNSIGSQQEVTGDIGAIYIGDFYGLLDYMSVPIDMHYITMRINGFYNSADYDGSAKIILIPALNEITILKNVFKTNKAS